MCGQFLDGCCRHDFVCHTDLNRAFWGLDGTIGNGVQRFQGSMRRTDQLDRVLPVQLLQAMLQVVFQGWRQSEQMEGADPAHGFVVHQAGGFGGGPQGGERRGAWKGGFHESQTGRVEKVAVPPAGLLGFSEIGDDKTNLGELFRDG